MWSRTVRPLVMTLLSLCIGTAAMGGVLLAGEAGGEMRVESRVFEDENEQPIGRSLALFANDVVWDFLELTDADGNLQLAEVVLHDPLRERTVLVDPRRNVKVELDKLTLDRLRVSLASWARTADDPVIRWAASSRVEDGIRHEHTDGSAIVLSGPKVRYVVRYEKAASPAAAENYQRFADVSLLVKALVNPGGLPPYPRMAINRRLARESAIPSEVILTLAGGLPLVGELPGGVGEKVLRSEHRTHPRLLAEDRRRIADASARIGESLVVPLDDYANPSAEAGTDVAREPVAGRSLTR
jgi:hypothetical protein